MLKRPYKKPFFEITTYFYIVGTGENIFEDFKNELTSTHGPSGWDYWLIYCFYTALPALRARSTAALALSAEGSTLGPLSQDCCISVSYYTARSKKRYQEKDKFKKKIHFISQIQLQARL